MPRSAWKGLYVQQFLVRKVRALRAAGLDKTESITTWSRRSAILQEFVGITFEVHNGIKFHKVLVTEPMVGRKLGEFSPTRKQPRFPKK